MNPRHLVVFVTAAAILLGMAVAPLAPAQAHPGLQTAPTITPIPLPSVDATPVPESGSTDITTTSATGQSIVVETPDNGTQVGSPVVISGYVSYPPEMGRLNWYMRDSNGAVLGSGFFPIGASLRFNVSLNFREPDVAGPLALELLDQAGDRVMARTILGLTYQPPYVPPPVVGPQIIIDTPPAGTQVGSPVVIGGRVTTYPYEGVIYWKIKLPNGTVLGSGALQVYSSGGALRWRGSLHFSRPSGPTPLVFEALQLNAQGQVVASATRGLRYGYSGGGGKPLPSPHPSGRYTYSGTAHVIVPSPGSRIWSPQRLVGTMSRYPAGGILYWRLLDSAGRDLGNGIFSVYPVPQAPAAFEVEIRFEPPPSSGELLLQLFEITDSREIRVAASIRLRPPY